MKKLWLIILGIIVVLAAIYTVTSLNDKVEWKDVSAIFRYDESKIDVGSVYHYIASDIAGKNSMNAYLYVQSKDTVSVYKDFSQLYSSIYFINYTMDWNHMMRKTASAYNPLNNKNLPKTELKTEGFPTDFLHHKLKIKSTVTDEKGKPVTTTMIIRYTHEPCYDYSFYHFDLQFAFRFLKPGVTRFMVGNTIGTDYADTRVTFIKEEKVDGIVCRKYELKSLGILATIFNAKGYVWLAKDDPRHYTVKYINYLERTSFWKNFKLQLKDIKKMDQQQWNDFLAKVVVQKNQELNLN